MYAFPRQQFKYTNPPHQFARPSSVLSMSGAMADSNAAWRTASSTSSSLMSSLQYDVMDKSSYYGKTKNQRQ